MGAVGESPTFPCLSVHPVPTKPGQTNNAGAGAGEEGEEEEEAAFHEAIESKE